MKHEQKAKDHLSRVNRWHTIPPQLEPPLSLTSSLLPPPPYILNPLARSDTFPTISSAGLPGRQAGLRRGGGRRSVYGSSFAVDVHRAHRRRLLHFLRGGTGARGTARRRQRDALRLRFVRSDGETRQRRKPRLAIRPDGDEQPDLFLRRTAGRSQTNAASRQHAQEITVFDADEVDPSQKSDDDDDDHVLLRAPQKKRIVKTFYVL